MVKLRRKKSSPMRLELASLLDAVFLLLIFFMLTSSFQRDSALELELPNTESGVQSTELDYKVAVNAKEQVLFQGTQVGSELLLLQVQELVKSDPSIQFELKIDKHVSFAKAIEVFDLLKSGGVQSVELGVRKK